MCARLFAALSVALVLAACGQKGPPPLGSGLEPRPSPSRTEAAVADDSDQPPQPGQTPAPPAQTRRPQPEKPTTLQAPPADSNPTRSQKTPTGPARQPPPPQAQAGEDDQPEPARPAPPGAYSYETRGTARVADGPPRDLPDRTTLTVHPPHGRTQRTVRDLRDRDGVGNVTEQALEYTDEGIKIVEVRITVSVAGVTNSYRLTAPDRPLVVSTGAQPGQRRQFTLTGDGVTIRTTATVEGRDTISVRDTSREVFILQLNSVLTGELQGTQVSRNWMLEEASIPAKEEVRSDVRSRGVRTTSEYQARLR